jgi:hypothetical protein
MTYKTKKARSPPPPLGLSENDVPNTVQNHQEAIKSKKS